MANYWLILIGFLVGTLGTLIGAGGGFILMPIFFILYPNTPSEQLTAMSLCVVFFNALSGSIAYGRKGKIDYYSGFMFSIAAIPGALLGSLSTSHLSRKIFDPIFSFFLITASIYLFIRSLSKTSKPTNPNLNNYPTRYLKEKDGTIHSLIYNLKFGMILSALVGYISSVLGIGGGIIHVPALIHLLNFPVHIATATSHFILAVLSLIGVLVHWYNGNLNPGLGKVIYLVPSVIIGAQLGAKLSSRIQGKWIVRCLAMALASVGIRLLLKNL